MQLVSIGHTKKPYGKDGFIRLAIEERYQADVLNARALFIDLDGSNVPFLIEKRKEGKDVSVKLEEIDTPEQASALSSKSIFLHEEEVKLASADAEVDANSMFDGYTVLNQDGIEKGVILSVTDRSSQLLAEVEKADGNVFIIPLHEDLILELNGEERTIRLEIMEGLEDLNV